MTSCVTGRPNPPQKGYVICAQPLIGLATHQFYDSLLDSGHSNQVLAFHEISIVSLFSITTGTSWNNNIWLSLANSLRNSIRQSFHARDANSNKFGYGGYVAR